MSERLFFKGISITQSLITQSLIDQTKAIDRYVIHFQLADETARRYMVRMIPNLSEC